MRATCNGATWRSPSRTSPRRCTNFERSTARSSFGASGVMEHGGLAEYALALCAARHVITCSVPPKKKTGALLANKVILHSSGHAAARSAQLPRLLAGRRLTIFDSSLPLLGTMCTRDPPDLESVDTRARLSKPPLSRPERRIASRPSLSFNGSN